MPMLFTLVFQCRFSNTFPGYAFSYSLILCPISFNFFLQLSILTFVDGREFLFALLHSLHFQLLFSSRLFDYFEFLKIHNCNLLFFAFGNIFFKYSFYLFRLFRIICFLILNFQLQIFYFIT